MCYRKLSAFCTQNALQVMVLHQNQCTLVALQVLDYHYKLLAAMEGSTHAYCHRWQTSCQGTTFSSVRHMFLSRAGKQAWIQMDLVSRCVFLSV